MNKNLSILIVDDDPLIVMTVSCVLQPLRGIEILTASNGIEALAVLGVRGEDICVLITDHDMPGMTGDELIANARMFPHIKSLLLSGRLQQHDVDAFDGPSSPDYFLAKPFGAKVLKELVMSLMTDFIIGIRTS